MFPFMNFGTRNTWTEIYNLSSQTSLTEHEIFTKFKSELILILFLDHIPLFKASANAYY